MRISLRLLLLASLWLLISSACSADLPDSRQTEEGEITHERLRLIRLLQETENSLSPYQQKNENVLRSQLAALIPQLQSMSSTIGRDDVLDLQHKFAIKENETRQYLDGTRQSRQNAIRKAADFKDMSKRLIVPPHFDLTQLSPAARRIHDMGKNLEKRAREIEQGARALAEKEEKLAREIALRERLSRLLGEIAKDLPGAKKQVHPLKK